MQLFSIDISDDVIAALIVLLQLLAFWGFFIVKYERKRSEFESGRQLEREHLSSQMEIQEEALKYVSREIHDNIGQLLSLVKLNLNTIDLDENDKARDKLLHSKELVTKVINDLRQFAKTLHADSALANGLTSAIQSQTDLVARAGVFKCGFQQVGESYRMDPKKELILFRIVQEAINNAIKHSDATCISVSAIFSRDSVILTIMDDGKGFPAHFYDSVQGKSQGLSNMKARAEMIGGAFTIQSEGHGTFVRISLTNELENMHTKPKQSYPS
jgi:two-component system NarL family sensor kinase